jgi:hypothetical protein
MLYNTINHSISYQLKLLSTVANRESWQWSMSSSVPDLHYESMHTLFLPLCVQLCHDNSHVCCLREISNPVLHICLCRSVQNKFLGGRVICCSGLQSLYIRPMGQFCHAEAANVLHPCGSVQEVFVFISAEVLDGLHVEVEL